MQDEAAWHPAEAEEAEAEGEGDLYEVGQECLDRIALSVGGSTLAPLVRTPLSLLQVLPEAHLLEGGESHLGEAEGEGDLCEIGQERLDRIALSVGGSTLAPLVRCPARCPPCLAHSAGEVVGPIRQPRRGGRGHGRSV